MEISDRIKQRFKELDIKAADVVKNTGISKGSMSQWVNGTTTPSGPNLIILSEFLQCSPEWLSTGKGNIHKDFIQNVRPVESKVPGLVEIPVISSVQAGKWADVDDPFEPGDADEWRVAYNVGKNSFALRVVGDSMLNPNGSPSIPEGSLVVVDPDCPPDSGKIVVAKLNDHEQVTLKKLSIDGPDQYLMPLNPKFEPMKISSNCTIVGVIKQVITDI